MTRRFLSLALALLAGCMEPPAPLLQAPQPTTIADLSLGGPVEITLWHAAAGASGKALEELVAKFNSTNPQKITVRTAYQGSYARLQQKSLAALQSGTLPELGTGFGSFVSDLQKAGVVVPLDPYLGSRTNGLDAANRDDLIRPFLDGDRYTQYANQLLSFPFQRAVHGMYANDGILEEIGRPAPRTWADFEEVARAATRRGADGRTSRFGWAVTINASTFNSWVVSRGGKLISDDGKAVAWDGREGLEALRLFQKLLGEGVAYVPRGFDGETDFAAGRVAFLQESSSFRPFLAAAMRRPVAWSVRGVPQTDAAQTRTVEYGPSFVLYRSTPEKQLAAWLFVKWFSERDQTAAWAAASASLPLRKSAGATDLLRKTWETDGQGRQAFDLAGASVPEPNVRGQQDVRTVIENLILAIASRSATDAEGALREAATKANAILLDNP